MSMGDIVNLIPWQIPNDYHCRCIYCQKTIGELRPTDGSYYSRLERRQYYDPCEKGPGGHLAKSPLHIARWAVQRYTKPGDWVLDPTIGSGTTAVEALTQGRNAAGMEIEYGEVVQANVAKAINGHPSLRAEIGIGDARNIKSFLDNLDQTFTLVVSNPPYSGDVSMPSPKGKLRGKEHRHLEIRFDYDEELPNLAFLKEGVEYWSTIEEIYRACVERLAPNGHFVFGVKDMMRNKAPFLLHERFADLLVNIGLKHVGTAFLKHYPGTLFLNAYEKMHGAKPPSYQTICAFRRS